MTAVPTCPICGKPVPESALDGICPACLLRAGASADTGEVGPNGTLMAKAPAAATLSPAEIAPHFPQLEILECLGRGGMGVVYKARQPQLNRLVALKILAPEKESDPKFADRFTREAQALARLNHPNIVTVHDFGAADGLYFLLMEFVDGTSLRELLRAGKMKPEQALAVVPKICEALQFAHERGIVHRDIKPENVLLDRDGRVKIADFGIAKIVGRDGTLTNLTEDKQVVGTPHYMAPEQVEKPQLVDHRADIYSLGVVFYEMLTGELPLGKFQPPSGKASVDTRLDGVVMHALEKEPERRYQHASEVKSDVATIAATPERVGTGAFHRVPDSTNHSRDGVESIPTGSGHTQPPANSGLFRWVLAARWTARVFGTLLLAFYGFFVLAEGLPPMGSQPEGVQLNFVALGLMLGGFIVGWKREGTAALLIASGWTLWQVAESSVRLNLFQTPLPVAALFAFYWWATRGRPTARFLTAVTVLAAFLFVGRLICPANVFLNGVIIDSNTGEPVPAAELRCPRAGQPADTEHAPNARSARNGRFNLYVGWHSPNKPLAISAPGYQMLQTNLGPRPLGVRRLPRNFQMVPLTSSTQRAVPPVVVRTIPESGSASVNASLAELRITFSAPMASGGVSLVAMEGAAFPETNGPPHFLDDGRTCVVPVTLQPGKVYALWMNRNEAGGFRDRAGQAAVPYLLIFETIK